MDSEIFDGLDPDQRGAVFSTARHTLVVAGPGSGKTRVLASRYAFLIEKGLRPESILAVTFTNRAALEMKKRVSALIGLEASSFPIGTFHSFCLKFLKKSRPGFSLYGRGEQVSLLKELGVKNPASALESISAVKNFLVNGTYEKLVTPGGSGILAAYQEALKARDALDLDDLIAETIRVLQERPESTGSGCSRFCHVLVDEYQDINPPQAHLVELIVSGQGASFFAIGDPDQSIYSFRGANLRGFFDFKKTYKEAEVRTLGRNYRSAGNIVIASKGLIEKNRSGVDAGLSSIKRPVMDRGALRPVRENGEEIKIVECRDERAEAEFVLNRIETIMGGFSSRTVSSGHGGGYRFSDFAVLIRANRQAAAIEEVFRSSSLPYLVIGPKPDIQGFIEHLRGVGVPSNMKSDMRLSHFIKAEGEGLGMDESVLSGLVHTAENFFDSMNGEDALRAFTEELCLMQPPDIYDIEADRVSIMTLHMAKGLEFPVVFVCGVEDGLLPLKMKGKETDTEEERRLFYVGMTRAKERLFLLSARRRRLWAELFEPKKSPFLSELPRECLKDITFEKKRAKRKPVQKGLFE
jgi:DNA helicase-2/ATP-dependent DNA helicase PcrA